MQTIQNNILRYKGGVNANYKTLFILPNGYGILKYIESLAEKLAPQTKEVIIPILSGQNGGDSKLGIETAVKEFKNIFTHVVGSDTRVNMICHCSALLYLSEIKDERIWKHIDKIILYSFLAHPDKHYDRFIKKSKRYGVAINEREMNLEKYSDMTIYEKIPCDIHVIHPKTDMNRLRASKKDLAKLSQLNNIITVVEPETGYEIEDDPQDDQVAYIINKYISNLM